jgi:NitT/TauT family transport system substrate-binding protein
MLKGCIYAATLGLAASAVTSALAQTKVSFLTNYVFHGRHSPYFVGLEKGIYKEAGFDIQISPAPGSGFVITALEGGKADYGMAESASVVQAVAKGAKAQGFSVFTDITTSGLASLKPYATPESLKGATVAASQNDSARLIVPIVFALKGLDPSTVQWQAADPAVYFSLLMSGKVDLVTASIDGDVPALNRVAGPQGKQVHFASFADWGYNVFGYWLVARADRIAANLEEATRFAAATAKAVDWSTKNPEETAKIMVKHNPTLDQATTLAQWQQAIKSIATPYVAQHGYGVATPDRVQRTIDLVKQAMKLESPPKPEDVYAASFMKK